MASIQPDDNKQAEYIEKEKIERQRELLSIEPEDREPEEVHEIMDYMKNLNFFKQYKKKPEFYDLCQSLYIESYETSSYIFKQGDSGEQAFVILSGEIIIYIDEPTEYRGFMTLKEKARLQKGNIFGQLALKNNQKRTATARAGCPTDLIIIEKAIFNKYFAEDMDTKPQITPHLRKLKSFLEGLDMFALMPSYLIDNLTTKCDIKKFPSNTIILKQGNDSAALYFVKQGKLSAVRLIPFRVNQYNKKKMVGDCQDPTPFEMENGLYQNEFIEIDELSDQDIFGDYSLLHQTEQDHSVITQVPTELVYINIFYVHQIIPEENLDVYKKSLKKYPNNVELRHLFWEKRNWEHYRKSLMENIILQKNNKSSFSQQLRLPILRQNYKTPPLNKLDIKTNDCNLYFNVLKKDEISRQVKAKKKIKVELRQLKYNESTQTGQELTQQLKRFGQNMKNTYHQQNSKSFHTSSLPSLGVSKGGLNATNQTSRYANNNKSEFYHNQSYQQNNQQQQQHYEDEDEESRDYVQIQQQFENQDQEQY